MGKCIIHKWNGCTCIKCGARREKNHRYITDAGLTKCQICGELNPYKTKCEKCHKNKADFDRANEEFANRMKSMGAGLFIGGGAGGLLRCSSCGKIVCSKCALELPGHTEKTCPFCNTDYGWGDVIV